MQNERENHQRVYWTEAMCEEAYKILCEHPQNLAEGCRVIISRFNMRGYDKNPSVIMHHPKSKFCQYLKLHPVIRVISGDNTRMIVGNKQQHCILDENKKSTGLFRNIVQFVSLESVRYTIVRE